MTTPPSHWKTDLDPIQHTDELLERDAPALWAALSPLGRQLRQPVNFLPQQTAEAKGKPFNATIGQITDGQGGAVPLPAMASALQGIEAAAASQAFLYSPVEGLLPLRKAVRAYLRQGALESAPSSLPIVTNGIVHARSLALQLVVPQGQTVLVLGGDPGGELRELVEVRLEGRLVEVGGVRELGTALDAVGEGEPAVVVVASETESKETEAGRDSLRGALLAAAALRPVVLLLDDRWETSPGGACPRSHYWSLAGTSPGLVAFKLDGGEGSWGFAGGRVGFLTLPFDPESALARALESKIKMLLRAEVGSPSSFTQTLFLKMLEGERVDRSKDGSNPR